MPLLKIQTNQTVEPATRDAILTGMTNLIAEELDKPREYVQVVLEPDRTMAFAGTTAPAAFVELRSLGMPESKPKAFTAAFCGVLAEQLGVPPTRVFVNFFDIPRSHWGWNGNTFA